MKFLFRMLTSTIVLVGIFVLSGCRTTIEQENQKHQREKLERPQPPPRL